MFNLPDYRSAYLRLAGKIRRTGKFYRLLARQLRAREQPGCDVRAGQLDKCADDMDFVFSKAAYILPHDERERVVAESNSPFRKENPVNEYSSA